MSLLEVRDLSVHFGGIEALKSITFNVDEGKIITLVGANGAGKSTTLRTISGLVSSASGSILFNGTDITRYDTQKIVNGGIAMVPEGRRVFPNLTVMENLKIGAYLQKSNSIVDHNIQKVFTLFPRLKERFWQLAGTLSGGEQQMLAVGRGLMSDPVLLMMDEPSLGLAPMIVQDIFSIIKSLNENGMTILLVEQNANAALKAAHYGYVMETGRIVLEGTGMQLLEDSSVREAYLGKASSA